MMPDEHPIVERPSLKAIRMWHGYNYQWNQRQMETLADYIEFLERELELCKASKGPFKKIDSINVR